MQFRISDTFTDSLARLTAEEQKAVKITAFDLQQNPASPGLKFHRIEKSKDKHFWSVRVGADLRLIVHKTESSFLLCFVGHHNKAYDWAERRRLETHPNTGAAQWVEVRDRVVEPQVARTPAVAAKPVQPAKRLLFAAYADDTLLAFGVPPDWLVDVKQADEDALLALSEHLPAEAAEALLELATGGKPQPVAGTGAAKPADPFSHPDAQRRFRLMSGAEELEQALSAPWEKWTIFLHPAQQQWMQRDFSGPARVSGSAGTGKTIVALHRAVHLARQNPDARVWLTTFSQPLAHALRNRMNCLISHQPRLAERLEVVDMHGMGLRLMDRLRERSQPKPRLATPPDVMAAVEAALAECRAKQPDALLARFNSPLCAGRVDRCGGCVAAPTLGGLPRCEAAGPQDPPV
jgi:mRNA-degrading endonuclease RelE of RelBE toxin-antitoxin system